MRPSFKAQTDHPIIIRRRTTAAVVIAGQKIERLVRSLHYVTQATELAIKVALKCRLVRISRVE
jgi:hypothetical protein